MPLVALEALLGLMPLNLHISKEPILAAYRLKTYKYWGEKKLTSVVLSHIIQKVSQGSVLSMHSDVMGTEYFFTHPYTVTLGTRVNRTEAGLDKFRYEMVRYNDGSRIDSRLGFRVYSNIPRLSIAVSLGLYYIVFQAEVCYTGLCS